MASLTHSSHSPKWIWIPVRVAMVTFLLSVLSFAISLFLAIVGLVIAGQIGGPAPGMPTAYRQIALPFAVGVAVLISVVMTVMEIRRFRQARALASIERAG